jgi:rRNA maturation RNase YbeY
MPVDFFPALPEEMEAGIDLHFEDVDPPDVGLEKLIPWIAAVIDHHQAKLGTLQYIFCSDDYLHQLNVEYLDHDTLTDIITFPYAPPPKVSGDLYISLERVTENAQDLHIPLLTELQRVMIHGVLHLMGYGDKTEAEAKKMRDLEAEALSLYLA